MSDPRDGKPTAFASGNSRAREPRACSAGAASRRAFLTSSVGLVTGGAAAGLIPGSARAQIANAGDAELAACRRSAASCSRAASY